jgi:hypothetical protein
MRMDTLNFTENVVKVNREQAITKTEHENTSVQLYDIK